MKAGHFPSRYPVRSVRDQLIAGRARASHHHRHHLVAPDDAGEILVIRAATMLPLPPPIGSPTTSSNQITPGFADRMAADALHAIEDNLMPLPARSLRVLPHRASTNGGSAYVLRLLYCAIAAPAKYPAEPAPTLTARSAYFVHAGRGEREREAAVRVEAFDLNSLLDEATVCGASSALSQVTVVPAFTVMRSGKKRNCRSPPWCREPEPRSRES